MDEYSTDDEKEMLLDGNAAAGMLEEIFAGDLTAHPAECANCGTVSLVGTLMAFNQAPGVVLRCPACEEVMMRLVRTPNGLLFEARGTVSILLKPR